jgi:large subunit ribosomal protein L17
MKHHRKITKLSREKGQREALVVSLANALIISDKMKTTEAKAKAIRPFIERLVTKAKANSLASRRLVLSRLKNETSVKKLFTTIAPKYATRAGGYVRIIKLPVRKSDGAKMAHIEFV